jgi:uracil-DNA glycosylase
VFRLPQPNENQWEPIPRKTPFLATVGNRPGQFDREPMAPGRSGDGARRAIEGHAGRSVPAFWNVFPFHPHPTGVTNKNRRPSTAEVAEGISFLKTAVEIFAPHTIIAVGGVAASVTTSAFPHVIHINIPHPSHRGTVGFISGCALLKIL